MQVLFRNVIFIMTFRRITILKTTKLALANANTYQIKKLSPQCCITIIIENTKDIAITLFRAVSAYHQFY